MGPNIAWPLAGPLLFVRRARGAVSTSPAALQVCINGLDNCRAVCVVHNAWYWCTVRQMHGTGVWGLGVLSICAVQSALLANGARWLALSCLGPLYCWRQLACNRMRQDASSGRVVHPFIPSSLVPSG